MEEWVAIVASLIRLEGHGTPVQRLSLQATRVEVGAARGVFVPGDQIVKGNDQNHVSFAG